MRHYDPNKMTQLTVDASPVGIGAVLTQSSASGDIYPVLYASRSLSDVERRYSQTEKEALAVVYGCEKFHLFLYRIEFEIRTVHKALEVIYSPQGKFRTMDHSLCLVSLEHVVRRKGYVKGR
jgi:hypothetical protein